MLNSVAVQADSLAQIKELWRDKKWTQVTPELLAYRNQPGGKTALVDYMLGTSECHIQEKRKAGETVLTDVLKTYRLSDQARGITVKAIEYCKGGIAATEEPAFLLVPVSGQQANGPTVYGKGGYVLTSSSQVTTLKVQTTPVPISELQGRIYLLQQADEALAAAKARVNGQNGIVSDRFVIVCLSHCELPLDMVGQCLEEHRVALHKNFDMDLPDLLVTVYVAPDLPELSMYAGKLHGISLPLGTVAYSVNEDLSMAGMAAYTGSSGATCGSLAHELVHLSIRENFGDSPAWLEEGLASEVAVADFNGSSVIDFRRSWRDGMLQDNWKYRPTVAEMVAADWTAYIAADKSSIPRVAALHAMAAVFIRYLDAKHKLLPVYTAIRDGRFPQGADAPRSDSSILEEQMRMSLAEIDADFVKWFDYSPAHATKVTHETAPLPPSKK